MRIIAGMPMYYGAKPKLFEYAKQMRHSPTEAEKVMWQVLTSNEFGPYKFRRQHPMFRYIADFFSHPLLLVIELDGGYHNEKEQQEVDIIRDSDMHEWGVTVLRFTNDQVLSNQQDVITKLNNVIAKLNK